MSKQNSDTEQGKKHRLRFTATEKAELRRVKLMRDAANVVLEDAENNPGTASLSQLREAQSTLARCDKREGRVQRAAEDRLYARTAKVTTEAEMEECKQLYQRFPNDLIRFLDDVPPMTPEENAAQRKAMQEYLDSGAAKTPKGRQYLRERINPSLVKTTNYSADVEE